jgi:hypothetical protein
MNDLLLEELANFSRIKSLKIHYWFVTIFWVGLLLEGLWVCGYGRY